jgi:hypothetical protein
MRESMPTWKIVLLLIAWVTVAAFMGVVAAIVGTEILGLFGIVESGEDSYQTSINIIWVIVFIIVLVIPLVYRKRFNAYEPPPET